MKGDDIQDGYVFDPAEDYVLQKCGVTEKADRQTIIRLRNTLRNFKDRKTLFVKWFNAEEKAIVLAHLSEEEKARVL